MYRYQLMAKRVFGIKSPLEKSIEKKLEDLENRDMIDTMERDYRVYRNVTYFTLSQAIWKSWIRR